MVRVGAQGPDPEPAVEPRGECRRRVGRRRLHARDLVAGESAEGGDPTEVATAVDAPVAVAHCLDVAGRVPGPDPRSSGRAERRTGTAATGGRDVQRLA